VKTLSVNYFRTLQRLGSVQKIYILFCNAHFFRSFKQLAVRLAQQAQGEVKGTQHHLCLYLSIPKVYVSLSVGLNLVYYIRKPL
jgi:hypothetical protein